MTVHLIADLQANYERFVSGVKKNGVVWGLKSDEGWAYCPSNDVDTDVLLFWSEEAYAKRHAIEEWSEYAPVAIDLSVFVERWLTGMHKDGLLVGVNFNANLAGIESKPLELAKALALEN